MPGATFIHCCKRFDCWIGHFCEFSFPFCSFYLFVYHFVTAMPEDDKDQNGGAWSRVPTWDGSPQTWRTFKREMTWWTSALDLQSTLKYNLAASWLLRQSGIVRQRGEEFLPEELEAQQEVTGIDPETQEKVALTPADPLKGLNKLMTALEGMNGRTTLDKKGELRNMFYQDLKRKPGERIAEFCSRFRVLVADLKTEGVLLPSSEVGWFFRTKLGLDPIRVQLLDTALGGAEEYETIEREVLRLFKELHVQDPLNRTRDVKGSPVLQRFLNQPQQSSFSRPSSYAPSMASSTRTFRSSSSAPSGAPSSRFSNLRKPKQVMVSETDLNAEEPEEEELVEDGGEPQSLEEVLQTEVEALATELEEAAELGVDEDALKEVEESVEAAAEALMTMKESRHRLQEVRKDRGYGKASGGADNKSKMNPKKTSKNPCFDCNLPGHWAGDPECKKPGQQLGRKKPKQVQLAEVLNTEHTIEEKFEEHPNEVLAVSSVGTLTKSFAVALEESHKTPKEVHAASSKMSLDKRLVGALDSACNRTCTGNEWLAGFLSGLREAPAEIRALVRQEEEHETFRFGNGGTQVSLRRWRLPFVVGDVLMCVWVSVVPVNTLGLLLGRDFLEAIGANLDFARRTLTCDWIASKPMTLKQLSAGHYLLHLLPRSWPSLDAQRWRRVGIDGVVELQLSTKNWLSRRLKTCSHQKGSCHDHLLTEMSVHAGHLVCTVLSSRDDLAPPVTAASSSMSSTSAETRTTTSSTTRSSLKPKDGPAAPRPKCGKVAQNDHPAQRKSHMGCKRAMPLALTKALLAISAFALPFYSQHRQVEAPSPRAGDGGNFASSLPRLRQSERALHDAEHGRMHSPSKPPWADDGILRRSSSSRYGGSSPCQGAGIQDPKTSQGGGHGVCQQSRSRGQPRSRSQIDDRSKRRTSISPWRLGASCSTSTCAIGGQGHHCTDQRKGQTNGRSAERKASGACRQEQGEGSTSEVKPKQGRIVQSASDHAEFGRPTVEDGHGFGNHVQRAHHPETTDRPSSRSSRPTDGGGRQGIRGDVHQRGAEGGGREHGRRVCRAVGRSLWGGGSRVSDRRADSDCLGSVNEVYNPYKLEQDIKKGQAQLISQAWSKHVADRVRVSQSAKEVREVLEADFYQEMTGYVNDETFFQSIDLSHVSSATDSSEVNAAESSASHRPLVSEIYTTAQNVMKEAKRRGHSVGTPMSLENGWNFLREDHREKALQIVREEKPFCLVLAFPCGPFSPLQRLNSKGRETLDARQADGLVLMRFAIQLAQEQINNGRHCILENPRPSQAWHMVEMRRFLEENDINTAVFDQCRFGLKSLSGGLHKKPTMVASSSSEVVSQLDGVRCMRDHTHVPVLGGSKITAHAGIYPQQLARALVVGIEKQFEKDYRSHEVLAAQADDDDLGFEGIEPQHPPGEVETDDEVEDELDQKKINIPASVRQAIKRLHENTGHRSTRRLARALAIAGAPEEAIVAAKQHRCEVCQERAPPKSRRPASLPVPKDFGDQVHIDVMEVYDAKDRRFFVIHATDYATRYQLAELMPDKSSKSVIRFMALKWVATFGAPRVLVCDQGREFISWEFEEWASSVSTMLHHIAVQAPWQNGIAERTGGVLETLLSAITASQSVLGREEMELALAEATAAYNGDINESGASPYQAAIGRQPRMVGDVLGGIGSRLAEHGLVDSKPSFARQIAMREVAKIAMTRLHFSRGLRKAELARSRNSTIEQAPEPGTICYFYRPLKYNSKNSGNRRKLTLKRWHGPALLVATEGTSSAYLSHKGQLTKCALEHVRVASTLEQIASDTWRDAIEEAVQQAMHDLALRPAAPVEAPEDPQVPQSAPGTPGFLPSRGAVEVADLAGQDLPPVEPVEIVGALGSAPTLPSLVGSSLPSRRVSDVTGAQAPNAAPASVSSSSQRPPLLQNQIEKAREIDEGSGAKRPAEVDAEQLREGDRAAAAFGGHQTMVVEGSAERKVPLFADQVYDALVMSRAEVEEAMTDPQRHPLLQVRDQACLDRLDPLEAQPQDHGTWDGRWGLPSRTEWQTRTKLGLSWPTGLRPHEVLTNQAARKEFHWKTMSDHEKEEFAKASDDAWKVWVENDAVEPLDSIESEKVRKRLAANRETSKILTPRYVWTDKNEPLRTPSHPLPLRARARIVVPGYQDVFSFSLRKDAPTASRTSQHLLLIMTACHFLGYDASLRWRLMSADVKSAFLKGDPYLSEARELYMENMRVKSEDEPKLPLEPGCLVKIRKGVFGLSDAPREWYLRLNRSLLAAGWERSPMDFACWLLWSEDHTELHGILISHVDDLLLGGNLRAQEKLKALGEELGFGSVEYDDFSYCGKRIRQKPDGSISISMVEYHQNLKPVSIPVHRRSTPQAELTAPECKQLRAVLGSLQWLVAQLRFDMGYHLSVLQGERPTILTLMKADQLLKEFKRNSQFELTFNPMDFKNAGIMVIMDASLGNVTKAGGQLARSPRRSIRRVLTSFWWQTKTFFQERKVSLQCWTRDHIGSRECADPPLAQSC